MIQLGSFPKVRPKLIDAFQRLFLPHNGIKAAFQPDSLCCWDMLYLVHGKSQCVPLY
jgi:hypothetical protein